MIGSFGVFRGIEYFKGNLDFVGYDIIIHDFNKTENNILLYGNNSEIKFLPIVHIESYEDNENLDEILDNDGNIDILKLNRYIIPQFQFITSEDKENKTLNESPFNLI